MKITNKQLSVVTDIIIDEVRKERKQAVETLKTNKTFVRGAKKKYKRLFELMHNYRKTEEANLSIIRACNDLKQMIEETVKEDDTFKYMYFTAPCADDHLLERIAEKQIDISVPTRKRIETDIILNDCKELNVLIQELTKKYVK